MRKLNLYDSYDNVVFSYKTDHKFHGAKRITIEAPTVLKKIVVEYPAKINGEFGIVAFDQPIDNPLYYNYIPQPFPLFVGETSTFDHFMFNGPDYFKIGLTNIVHGCILVTYIKLILISFLFTNTLDKRTT